MKAGASLSFSNPFKPGAGHMPPYLAGRSSETDAFLHLLKQETILSNMILTGLRGVGKTVLLENWKPLALERKWLWVGTDLSESASVNEEMLVIRLLTDLSVITSGVIVEKPAQSVGFAGATDMMDQQPLNYQKLLDLYRATPGLPSDKLKAILEFVWSALKGRGFNGIIFAYDEAQTMSDHAEKEQYPLSLLLDVFQSLQKKNYPLMLILVGLPTLFPKLVEARTFSERMFEVITLSKLDRDDSLAAVAKPIESSRCPVKFTQESIELIINTSGGYPYFIQFICRELYDIFLLKLNFGKKPSPVPINEITRKLDKDFFAGRWSRATDRQRELLSVIATLDNHDTEFTVQEIVAQAKGMANPFGASHVSQMLAALTDAGLVYKHRHGKYSFAVPLLGQFILRQERDANL
jgi:hypothetical protein